MKKDFMSVKYMIIISFWRDCAYGIVENGLKKCERQQVEESQSNPSEMRHEINIIMLRTAVSEVKEAFCISYTKP